MIYFPSNYLSARLSRLTVNADTSQNPCVMYSNCLSEFITVILRLQSLYFTFVVSSLVQWSPVFLVEQ